MNTITRDLFDTIDIRIRQMKKEDRPAAYSAVSIVFAALDGKSGMPPFDVYCEGKELAEFNYIRDEWETYLKNIGVY